MYKIRLTGDLYDIVNRIKEIDKSYFIMRNNKLKRFEIHSDNQKGDTLCVIVPYDKLDFRTLQLLRQTHVDRASALIKEIELNNLRLLKQENNLLREKAHERLDRMIDLNFIL
ncbi:MAG: hypothetical protein LBU60_06260 [Clostridiales bacterium]|jgi:hypothetical protein|nr:hypothetical protein [Clostridiales bacterium]